jgi:hypothetical protein
MTFFLLFPDNLFSTVLEIISRPKKQHHICFYFQEEKKKKDIKAGVVNTLDES